MSASRINDPARLAALDRSGLLGRPLSDRLERLVLTAAELLQADAAQMNVLDADHQHHLTRWPPVVSSLPSPLKESGCQYVIERMSTIAVHDTSTDPVLCVMPWATQWRSYLGTPVCFEGQAIGALCVLSVAQRTWQRTDVMTLEAVGRLIAHAL